MIDGPFTEAKEVIGGYAQFDLTSKEEAIKSAVKFMDLHKQLWPGWEGETEVRQMFGPEDFLVAADNPSPPEYRGRGGRGLPTREVVGRRMNGGIVQIPRTFASSCSILSYLCFGPVGWLWLITNLVCLAFILLGDSSDSPCF